ncbi:MAG: hypothetical protein K9G12_06875 [Candidatus Nanopelagicales bacterium]|nr:hypothetical protein [Candidatus Nanopelagicales bacterium]MCF8539987.1 hypothetical protein [Candidatus Nanopelagicales bacterium]
MDVAALRTQLESLRGVSTDSVRLRNARLWAGADVIVTDVMPEAVKSGFRPDARYVVTPFAHQLSWLIVQMWESFKPFMNGTTKIEFFGRLANAANRQIAGSETGEDASELLHAVLHEGFAIADELEDGSFQYLVVAVGNNIYDDLIDEAERQGYLTVDETLRWFSDRGLS